MTKVLNRLCGNLRFRWSSEPGLPRTINRGSKKSYQLPMGYEVTSHQDFWSWPPTVRSYYTDANHKGWAIREVPDEPYAEIVDSSGRVAYVIRAADLDELFIGNFWFWITETQTERDQRLIWMAEAERELRADQP